MAKKLLLKVANVFVPGKLPQLTYNPRADLELEQHLEDFLDEGGAILTVAGPTKTGKSVLLRRTIDQPIWCDGEGIGSVGALWELIADELRLYTQLEVATSASETGGGSLATKAGVEQIATVTAQAQYSATDTSGTKFTVSRPLVSVVKEAISTSGRPLVIDDFHFVDRDVQRQIVRALKPVVLAGVPVIFASISHRVQDVVSAEPDMTGRVVPLKIPFWSEDELLFIARKGFEALGVADPDERLARVLAAESYGSPHLMQKFCRELCKENGIRMQQKRSVTLNAPDDWPAFFRAQVEHASRDWFERLLNGPQERGKKRNQWQVKGNGTLDGYGLTLRAIAETGPQLDLTKDQIRRVVEQMVDGAGPASHQTTRYLQRMSLIAAKRKSDPLPTEEELDAESVDTEVPADVQPVLEYMDDDPNSRVHIADPYFAFFLRWGSSAYLHNAPPVIG